MRRILFALLTLFAATTHAGELEEAYKKEFAYLVSEKKALEERLASMRQSQDQRLSAASAEIEALQQQYLQKQNVTDRLNRRITEASRDADQAENDGLLMETTLIQAEESLDKLGMPLDEGAGEIARLEQAFASAAEAIAADGTVTRERGTFFGLDGRSLTGEVFSVGRIARYGLSAEGSGLLAPAGDGQFKIWASPSPSIAEQLAEGLNPASIDVFLFENTQKAVEKREETTLLDQVEAGGIVGYVIIGLGALGVLLTLLRMLVLLVAGSNTRRIARGVSKRMHEGGLDEALAYCKRKVGAASNVVAAALRNLDRDREHIEDIISESILHESSRIDRFGTAILVIAAVAPLLGLLGTVTGMISTFDIIAEFGTGDPKLLSSGISEALVTTKFGLVVAIPLLLIGNVLSGWGARIKNGLEQSALHVINVYKP